MAFHEQRNKGKLALWLRPHDLQGLFEAQGPLPILIDAWKRELNLAIAKDIQKNFGTGEQKSPIFENIEFLISSIETFFRSADKSENLDRLKIDIMTRFLKDSTIDIFIDDLDQGWSASQEDTRRISALFAAIRDISGTDRRIKFRVALRTDVYYLVRTSDESTDKIETNLVWLTWSNHEILTLMAKRIQRFFDKFIDEKILVTKPQFEIAKEIHVVINGTFSGAGKWANAPIHRVLLSLTRKRPRDLIKLFHGAAKEAYRHNRNRITTEDLKSTFEQYSGERLQDIVNEFKSELREIEFLVHSMRPTRQQKRASQNYLFSNDQLIHKLNNAMTQKRFEFANGKMATAKALAEFLYKVDFIIARKEQDDGEIIRKFYEQNRFLANQFVDYGFDWEIHPAYRWALQPQSAESIFSSIDLVGEGTR